MDLRKIKKLIELLEDSTLAELEIHSGDERISLRRSAEPPPQLAVPRVVAPVAAEPEQPQESAAEDAPRPKGEPVTSPIVGTYYEAPSPNAIPFVRPGKRVAKGDTLCIIEAMKMMNEIKAPTTATVLSIEVQNAQPVEYGQVLMYLDS